MTLQAMPKKQFCTVFVRPIRVAESISSAASSAGQASADRTAMPQGNGRDSFVSLASGAKAEKTLLLEAATFASTEVRRPLAHALIELCKFVPKFIPFCSQTLDTCSRDSDCPDGSYCTSKSVCVQYDSNYCNTNSCGLGDGGSCFVYCYAIYTVIEKIKWISTLYCCL